jgi:hypothetical protein
MSHIVVKYFVYFKGNDKERVFIQEEERALKLQKILLSENPPKFFELNGTVYSTSSVDSVAKESETYQ